MLDEWKVPLYAITPSLPLAHLRIGTLRSTTQKNCKLILGISPILNVGNIGEYFMEYCQCHGTLLWIWIMLWRTLRYEELLQHPLWGIRLICWLWYAIWLCTSLRILEHTSWASENNFEDKELNNKIQYVKFVISLYVEVRCYGTHILAWGGCSHLHKCPRWPFPEQCDTRHNTTCEGLTFVVHYVEDRGFTLSPSTPCHN